MSSSTGWRLASYNTTPFEALSLIIDLMKKDQGIEVGGFCNWPSEVLGRPSSKWVLEHEYHLLLDFMSTGDKSITFLYSKDLTMVRPY